MANKWVAVVSRAVKCTLEDGQVVYQSVVTADDEEDVKGCGER